MSHIQHVNEEGLQLIKKFEGLRLQAYLCQAGRWTIGYGLTYYPNGVRVKKGDIITVAEAERFLKHILKNFEEGVDNTTPDTLTQNQFNALVSFAFNLGVAALRSSTLLRLVNADPNDPDIKKEFAKWVYADGKKSKGLITRRNAEAEHYFS